jgi:L-ascorbate metabolism protein UlaG (beta-lactamase superfamily)
MWIASIVMVVILGGGAALLQSPSFGKNPDKKVIEALNPGENYNTKEKKFLNPIPTKTSFSFSDFRKTSKEYLRSKDSVPRKPDILIKTDTTKWVDNDSLLWISWLGHSSEFVSIEGIKVLIDPIFSKRCSPFQWAGSKRFHPFPHDTSDFPIIDAVVISHDHYDHLDTKTIKSLKNSVKNFIVPLGVGSHLEKWGVEKKRIRELNWWDSVSIKHVTFHCTPARHFSGRRIKHQNETLWASWVLKGKSHRLFYSGDTGYFTEFKNIGKKLGPFDIALIQTGAYDSLWADIHMFPPEVIQTYKDVSAQKLIPVHWGTFNLALHNWKEPALWLKSLSKSENIPVVFPKLNEQIFANDSIVFKEKEWFE